MSSNTGNNAFVKHLASSDKRIRDNALDKLRHYLRGRSHFDSLELLKLWKGLYYCMWMADRTRTQQQLARDLASLVDECRPKVVMPFLDAFWKTMAREWVGIDVLRMDKFLYLVRQYLHASFRHISRQNWARTKAVEECMDVICATPLNVDDLKIPDGLRYHVIDIYVDELEKIEDGEEEMPVEVVLGPLERIGKESRNKKIRERVKEALEDDRVRSWRGEEVRTEQISDDGEGEDAWAGLDD